MGGQLVNPRLVLPFLYLALGAPTFLAGLLLPLVTGARLIAEIFVSPFINKATRAKLAVYVPNLMTGLVLAVVALFATNLPVTMVVLLFLLTAITMGFCQGITSLGTSQIYGLSVPNTKRNRMVFAQATVSGLLAIVVVWVTKDLLVSDQPIQRHIVVMWCGVLAMIIAGISFVGVKIFEDEQSQAPEERAKPKPISELTTGFKTGMAHPWFRKFVFARLLFVSVELAMPFYTIHAATYHIGTKNSLSYFVIAASAGMVVGSILWGRLSERCGVKPVMWMGCMTSALSAILALVFAWSGLAHNVWLYAFVIFLLSLGGNGVVYGRYLFVIECSTSLERPYLVAFGDVSAGLVGVAFAAILGAVAHHSDPIVPIAVLVVLNLAAMLFAFYLPGSVSKEHE